ncbi:MAG: GatB/YqeY domain-containing protein [Chromatiales bacterium]|jgi:uncharacterized protein YqeY
MLKPRIQEDVKAAMRSGDKRRLGILRLITAGIKQREVDDRSELDDAGVLALLDKMVKQRRESIAQYEKGGRDDLVRQEAYEIEVLQHYLPEALSEAEIAAAVDEVIADTGAASVRDMGKVMGQLKPRLQGRADMGAVSALVKHKLSG